MGFEGGAMGGLETTKILVNLETMNMKINNLKSERWLKKKRKWKKRCGVSTGVCGEAPRTL